MLQFELRNSHCRWRGRHFIANVRGTEISTERVKTQLDIAHDGLSLQFIDMLQNVAIQNHALIPHGEVEAMECYSRSNHM